MDKLNITIRKSDLECGGHSDIYNLQLGGVKIYGPSKEVLEDELELLSTSIQKSAKEHLTTARNVLSKLTRVSVGLDALDRRLFGAILGQELRFGRLDSVVCASEKGKKFWVYIHQNKKEVFLKGLLEAKKYLLENGHVDVKQLEASLFGSRRYNTWSSTAHVLSRLAYIGVAEYVDKNSVQLTPGLIDAAHAVS